MDNFRFDMTHEGDESLASALSLVWSARGLTAHQWRNAKPGHPKPGATHYAIRPAFAGERMPVPEGAPKGTVGAWCYGKEPKSLRLVFYDFRFARNPADGGDQIALPFTLDAAGAAEFARRWLEVADYGREPDHDGDNGKGWRVYNEAWGHVDGDRSAIIAVAPSWAMYGK